MQYNSFKCIMLIVYCIIPTHFTATPQPILTSPLVVEERRLFNLSCGAEQYPVNVIELYNQSSGRQGMIHNGKYRDVDSCVCSNR